MVGGMRPLAIVSSETTASTAPGRRQGVPDHRLVRGDRHGSHPLAEHGDAAHRLHLVVLRRAGAVSVDRVDLVRGEPGIVDRLADRGDDRGAVRARARAVEAVALLAAAEHVAEDRGAPRPRALSASSRTSAAAPSPMTKPSRFLENGFAAPSGGSFWVESADRSEKRTSDSGFTEPSVPMQSAASISPRRIASTPSWIAVAPEEQAVESEIGEPLVPKRSAIRSATVPKMNSSCQSLKRPVRGGAEEIGVGHVAVPARRLGQRLPLRPFHLDRRHGDEQPAGEVGRPADAGLATASSAASAARRSESTGATDGLDGDEVDRAGDAGAQALGREAPDGVDAGPAGGQRGPVVRLALAEGGDHPHARSRRRGGGPCCRAARVIAITSQLRQAQHALAAPVADGGHHDLRRVAPRDRAPRRGRAPAGACASMVCPRRSPVARGVEPGLRVGERLPFLGRDPGDARRAGQDQRLGADAGLRPEPPERRGDVARLAPGPVGGGRAPARRCPELPRAAA